MYSLLHVSFTGIHHHVDISVHGPKHVANFTLLSILLCLERTIF